MEFNFTRATSADLAFITEAIYCAERSGASRTWFESILGIEKNKLKEIIKNVLHEEIDGFEWCLNNFLIGKNNDVNACCCSAWIEQDKTKSSALIKSDVYRYFFGSAVLIKESQKLKLLADIAVEREAKVLQIDCVYVDGEFRGNNLLKKMVGNFISLYSTNMEIKKMQATVIAENIASIKAFNKAGFQEVVRTKSVEKDILSFFMGTGQVLMERNIHI